MRVRLLPAIVVAALFWGCASVTQTYSGPERPLSEVAVLKDKSDANVLAIDGVTVWGSAWSLLPGPHDVWLHVRVVNRAPNVNWTISSYCRVLLRAVAGEEYTSRVRVSKQVAPGLSEKLSVEVGIADSQGVLLAATNRCTRARPDLDGR